MPWLPPTIYGAICFIGGVAVFALPETLGQPLLTTVEEAHIVYGKKATGKKSADTN